MRASLALFEHDFLSSIYIRGIGRMYVWFLDGLRGGIMKALAH